MVVLRTADPVPELCVAETLRSENTTVPLIASVRDEDRAPDAVRIWRMLVTEAATTPVSKAPSVAPWLSEA